MLMINTIFMNAKHENSCECISAKMVQFLSEEEEYIYFFFFAKLCRVRSTFDKDISWQIAPEKTGLLFTVCKFQDFSVI